VIGERQVTDGLSRDTAIGCHVMERLSRDGEGGTRVVRFEKLRPRTEAAFVPVISSCNCYKEMLCKSLL
jgi:hypothetical protein